MSIKLLESLSYEGNEVLQQIDDGALMNFQSANRTNGILYGCKITNTASAIKIGAGVLMVRGYRLKFIGEATTVYSLSSASFPASATTYYLWLRITRVENDASYEFILSTNDKQVNKTEIEKETGAYDFKVARLTLSPSGISGNVESVLPNITAGGSGSTSSGSGAGLVTSIPTATTGSGNSGSINSSASIAITSLATPDLTIIGLPKITINNGAAYIMGNSNSIICVGNKTTYSTLVGNSGYDVKFVLYRFIEDGRYRQKRNGSKFYTFKTGYVRPIGSIGYKGSESQIKLVTSFKDLGTVQVNSSGQYQYRRTDVLANTMAIINETFYETIEGVKTPVSLSTNLADIKCVRSKSSGRRYGRTNMFVKLAWKAELRDSNNRKVAESALSKPLIITLNYYMPNNSINLGQRFKVKLGEI